MKAKFKNKRNGYAIIGIMALVISCVALTYMMISLLRTQQQLKVGIGNAKARMEIQKSILLAEKMRDLEQLRLTTAQKKGKEAIVIDAMSPLERVLEKNLTRAARYYAYTADVNQAQAVARIIRALKVQHLSSKADGPSRADIYEGIIKTLRTLETAEDNQLAALEINHQDPALLLIQNARLLEQLTDEVSDIGNIARRLQEAPAQTKTESKRLDAGLKRLVVLHNDFARHFSRLRAKLTVEDIPQISDFGLNKQLAALEKIASPKRAAGLGLTEAREYGEFSIIANASAKRVYEQIIERLIMLNSQKVAKIISNKELIWMIFLIFAIAILLASIAYIKRNTQTMRKLKSLNKSLARSENNIRKIIELLPHIVVLHDINGKILMENKAFRDFCAVVEKAKTDDLDKGGDCIEKILQAENIKLSRNGGATTSFERCVAEEGKNTVLQITSVEYPITDTKTAILTVMIDVTEVHKVKELQKVSGVGYWEWDLSRNLFSFSDKFYEAVGIDHNPEGDNFKEYIDCIVPGDRYRVMQAFSESMETYKQVDIEHRIRGNWDKERVVKIKGEVYQSSQNGAMRMVGYVQDITAQKMAEQVLRESEQKYRKLVENLSERYFFYSYDIVNGFSYMSPTAPAMFGFDDGGPFVNKILKKISDYVIKSHVDAESSMVGKSQLHGEVPVKNGEDGDCTLELSVVPVYSRTGEFMGFDGIAHDVTVKKLRESRLKDSEYRLRELAAYLQDVRENERASIARDIHDEIGGYLMALKMDISLLGKRLDKKDISIHARFESMKQLLDIAIESTRKMITTLRPSILDELGLLAALEWQLKEFGMRYGVKTLFSSDDKTANAAFVHSEYNVHIFRIFQEVLNNVAKHASAKNVNTRVAVNGSYFVLSVTDDGIGFAQETAKIQGSYGILGMQERIYKMNGKMEILSDVGIGTTVELQVPFYVSGSKAAGTDTEENAKIGRSV